MYLKEKVITILKIKNIILSIIAVILIFTSIANIAISSSSNWGNMETVWDAYSAPESEVCLIIGLVLVLIIWISRTQINNAVYYSGYFEGDLDGKILFSDLAQLMKKNVMLTRIQLFIYRKIYMKGFEFVTVNNAQQIVLDSKIGVCKCRSCGAAIEKQMMFNGICPYCESSDLFAGVLSDNHFYSITYQTNNKKINPDYYTSKKINILIPVFAFFLFIGIMIITGAGIVCCKHLIHLNDRAYYTKIMNESNKFLSYERMRKNAINEIIWLNALILMVTPLVIEMILRLRSIYVAVKSSKYLIKRKKPFISPGRLPTVKGKNRGLRTVTMALRLGYLVNCCFEIHDDEMVLALSKKVVKDRCPHCGASIVGAVDDHYKCSYCGNMLMGVIKPR